MKKWIVLVAAMLLSLGNVSAQQRGGGRQQMSVEEQVSNLKKELSLTDEQTEKVTTLYTDFQKKMQAGDREQMRTEREKLNTQIEALLTDEQKAAFQKSKTQMQGRGGSGRGQKGN
ncbi:MAG: hypothetical protein ACI3ZY_15010 [Parabacteroides sp.]